jgi:hypothetical protein
LIPVAKVLDLRTVAIRSVRMLGGSVFGIPKHFAFAPSIAKERFYS